MTARFGRYELMRPLGAGGMAEVFLARYTGPEGFEKRLVIKRLLPRLADDPHLLRMFFEEARTHVSLSHGNLVPVFDFGRVGNDYFIAMEHVLGADLALLAARERAEGRVLPPSLVAYVGIELCRGLGYVHRRGFVHRDVSPRNVLLSVDGEVKLSDFGLVLKRQSDAPSVRGTLAYTSPEQARGEPVDGRGDLYALGVVLAEAASGQRLREAADSAAALALARTGAPIAIEGPLGAIVARATQTAPDARYASADEMLAALEAAAAALGTGREASVRDLAARVARLAPATNEAQAAAPDLGPRPQAGARAAGDDIGHAPTASPSATAHAKRTGGALADTYFRDHESASFVDEVLATAAVPPRRRWRGWAPWLAAGLVGALAAGGLTARLYRRTARSPAATASASPTPGPMPSLARSAEPHAETPAAPNGSATPPGTIASNPSAPTGPVTAPPSVPSATAAPRPARHAAAPTARPSHATGTLLIHCTPWCVPYVDDHAEGQDGRNHTLTLPAGTHRVEARRLEDRLHKTVQVRPAEPTTVEFSFGSKFD